MHDRDDAHVPDEGAAIGPRPPSDDFWSNLLGHVFRTWVIPEVERRREAGSVEGEFLFEGVQVVMETNRPVEVRLNNEIRGAVFLDGPEVTAIDPIDIADFYQVASRVRAFTMDPDDRPNAAHITAINHRHGWYIDFDLRYNAGRAAHLIANADEFLKAADNMLNNGLLRPFVEALFAAVELMAKTTLLLHPDAALLKSNKHSFMLSRIHQETNRGNVDRDLAKALQRLSHLRNDARYGEEGLSIDADEARELYEMSTEYRRILEPRLPTRSRMMLSGD